ncbi:OsmC family protein [Chloroflexota bacterium]
MADTKNAKVVWQGAMAFDAFGSTYSDDVVKFDAAEAVGGQGRGFRPLEMLLMGLAGCTAMDVISILQKKKQAVTAFEVAVEGIQIDEHPKVFGEISVVYRVTGHNVDEKAVARAIDLSETKYCPAAATLRDTATINSRYEIIEAAAITA